MAGLLQATEQTAPQRMRGGKGLLSIEMEDIYESKEIFGTAACGIHDGRFAGRLR